MRKTMLFLLVLSVMIAVVPLAAQQQTDDGEKLVTVPKKYVSAEGLNHQTELPSGVGQWIGIGKEVGIATREGLNAVVDVAEKFGSTKVGTFVMVMIAWKIMAKDILGIVLGVPLLIGGVCLWIWAMRRLFFGYRVLVKKEGKVKTYEDHPAFDFASGDARAGAAVCMFCALTVWLAAMIFGVIF